MLESIALAWHTPQSAHAAPACLAHMLLLRFQKFVPPLLTSLGAQVIAVNTFDWSSVGPVSRAMVPTRLRTKVAGYLRAARCSVCAIGTCRRSGRPRADSDGGVPGEVDEAAPARR